jgi:predicted DCC family thiol-disulfide oxidoreductase YuxK
MGTTGAITVYYDGLCPVCGREVALYRRVARRAAILWRDLAGDTDVLRGESFDLDAALALLHVRDAGGVLHVGLAAHLVLWDRLPGLHRLAAVLRAHPRLRRAFDAIYVAFTRRRPGLRRRRPGGAGHA